MYKYLYFLSKTDRDVIERCPQHSRNIQLTLGFFVLLTGLLAFISGSYAISNIFVHADLITGRPVMSLLGWPASILLGTIYAASIMAIDREIVSAANKYAAVLRLPLAIVISLVVSVPVELQLFSSRIERQIIARGNKDDDNLRKKLHEEQAPLEIRRDTLLAMKNRAIADATQWSSVMEIETRGGDRGGEKRPSGEGPVFRAARDNRDRQEQLVRDIDKELAGVYDRLAQSSDRSKERFSIEKNPNSWDLLSRYMALHQLNNDPDVGSAASRMSWGVTLLFMLFELIPSIMKILLPQSDYDVLLDKRRLLNILSAKRIYEEARYEYYELDAEQISQRNPEMMNLIYRSQSGVV